MTKLKALIAELIEFGIWYDYHEYYDLYQLGDKKDKRKKGVYVADAIRRWRKKVEEKTGSKPKLIPRKKEIPKEFSRKNLVEGMQRVGATLDGEGNIVSEKYSKLPEPNDFDPVKSEWDPFFTTLNTRNGQQWIRYKKPVEGFSEEEKKEFLYRKQLLEDSKKETNYRVKSTKGSRMWLLLGCIHIPFQNKWLMDGVFRLMQDNDFDGIILGGDNLDICSISKYSKGKEVPYTLWDEYLEAVKVRKEIDRLIVGKEKYWINGNHEARVYKFLEDVENKKLGAAFIGIDRGVGLSENGWKYLPNWEEDSVIVNNCEVLHGQYLSKHPWVKHCEISSPMGMDSVFWHSHKFGMFTNGVHTAYNLGMLGDMDSDGFKYVSKRTRQTWSNGLGVMIEDKGINTIIPIKCTKRSFWCFGKKY